MAKPKVIKYPTPKNEAEAAALLGELERLKLQLDAKQVALNQEVNELITRADREAETVSEEFAQKFTALKSYATKQKDELTKGGRKSVIWATGTLGWRSAPAGISVPRSAKDIAILIERILKLRKEKFLRPKWELNVEAMEASPEEATAIEGINQRAAKESFYIQFPNGTEIAQKIKLKAPSSEDLKNLA